MILLWFCCLHAVWLGARLIPTRPPSNNSLDRESWTLTICIPVVSAFLLQVYIFRRKESHATTLRVFWTPAWALVKNTYIFYPPITIIGDIKGFDFPSVHLCPPYTRQSGLINEMHWNAINRLFQLSFFGLMKSQACPNEHHTPCPPDPLRTTWLRRPCDTVSPSHNKHQSLNVAFCFDEFPEKFPQRILDAEMFSFRSMRLAPW